MSIPTYVVCVLVIPVPAMFFLLFITLYFLRESTVYEAIIQYIIHITYRVIAIDASHNILHDI